MLPGGQELRRQGDETFVMAQKRIMQQQAAANTHFVMVVSDSELNASDHEVYFIPAIGSNSDSDMSEDEREYVAYPAERTLRDRSGKRREVFDGIYPPSAREYRETLKKEQRQRKDERQNKENIPVSARRAANEPTPRVSLPRVRTVEGIITNKPVSRIEQLADEPTEPNPEKRDAHQEKVSEEPARRHPGPGVPPARIFNPADVKKIEIKMTEENPPRKTVEKPRNNVVPEKEDDRVRYKAVASQRPRYNANDDDAIMEDTPAVRRERKETEGKQSQHQRFIGTSGEEPKALVPMHREEPKHMPRISEISAKIDPRLLLDRILNSQIQLTAREILAVSKDLSSSMIDLIKPKSSKDRTTADTFLTQDRKSKTRGDLIYINTEINGRKIRAIYDTGSEINILNTAIYRQGLGLPADMDHVTNLRDANGGLGTLQGIIHSVPIEIGSIKTIGTVLLNEKAPFELLLGRSWQSENRVGLIERADGTYLTFPNPASTDAPDLELMITPRDEVTCCSIQEQNSREIPVPIESYFFCQIGAAPPSTTRATYYTVLLQLFILIILSLILYLIDNIFNTLLVNIFCIIYFIFSIKETSIPTKSVGITDHLDHTMERATSLIFQPDTSVPEYAGRGANELRFPSAFESGTLRENAKFSGSHTYLGNHVADYIALNAYQYRTFGDKIKHAHPFQLLYALSCPFSYGAGGTMPSHFHFGSPILPHDAREIRSPCLVAFGRRSQPGPFLQEYQKHIAPSDITSPSTSLSSSSPPAFQCDYLDLGRAVAHFHAAFHAAKHAATKSASENSKPPLSLHPADPRPTITTLPPPPRIGRKDSISPLSIGGGTLANLESAPTAESPALIMVPIGEHLPMSQSPSLTTPSNILEPLQDQYSSQASTLPAQTTALNGRLEVGNPRVRAADTFGDIRPPSSSTLPVKNQQSSWRVQLNMLGLTA